MRLSDFWGSQLIKVSNRFDIEATNDDQRKDQLPMPAANSLGDLEVWFLTGSQHLYGEETLRQVAAQSGQIAAALNAANDIPVRVVWKPVLTAPEGGT